MNKIKIVKKCSLLALFLMLGGCGFAQQKNLSSYKVVQAQINGQSIIMHLHQAGPAYFGYYYNLKKQQLFYFNGDDTTKQGKIFLNVYAPEQADETILFNINQQTVKGSWKQGKNSTVFEGSVLSSARLPFTYVFTSGVVKLRPKLKRQSPQATFDAGAVWPTETSAWAAYLKSEIKKQTVGTTATGEIGALLLQEKKRYFNEYLSEYKNISNQEISEAFAPFSREQQVRTMVAFSGEKLITLATFQYSYAGGAHGMYSTGYVPIDVAGKKVLQLEDVFKPGALPSLTKMLERAFRKHYNVPASESLQQAGIFDNVIKASNNFYLTEKGIGFNYVPYEIGPYALGEVLLFLPYAALDAQLAPSFKKKINLK